MLNIKNDPAGKRGVSRHEGYNGGKNEIDLAPGDKPFAQPLQG